MPVLAGKGVAVDALIFVALDTKDVDFAPVVVVDGTVVVLDFTEEVVELVLIFVLVVGCEAEEALDTEDVDFAIVVVVAVLDFKEEVVELVWSDVVVKIGVCWLVFIAEDGVRTGSTTIGIIRI